MNKTAVAQQLKTASFLPPPQGLLQRKCACGNYTVAGGECAECAKKKNGLQRKLAIGASNDPLELEADRVAEQVMAASTHSTTSRAPLRIQRFAGQMTEGTDTAPASVDRVLASSGSPLEPALRQDMDQRFGYDFSRVRVHTGAAAEQSAERVNAEAYTVSNSIVFGAGRFAPGTLEGRRLIAHELTHVVQQCGAAHALHRRPKRTAEERDAILVTAAQAAFTSFDEQIDAQVEAEELLGLDSKRNKDKAYAWKLGQHDKAQIQKSGNLTTEHQHEITVKIRFFSGDAKRAYLQTINGAVSEAAEGEQVTEMLAEPGIPGAGEQEETEGLGCDAGKKQFPLLYEGEPERSTCIDITTDKQIVTNYFDNNIAKVDTYAVPGTTWENVEYSSFSAMVVTYKNGTSEYFMLDAVGNFYYGGQALALREFFYYKRSGTGLIYPVKDGRLYSSELLTPNLISYKNGLRHTVKDLQSLFDLVKATAAFASIIASYSVVEGFRVSLQGFRIPRGTGKAGGGKGGGGGAGDAGEPGGTVRSPGNEKGGGQPQGSGTPQKLLSSSQLKGTGKLTSDPVRPGMIKRGEAKAGQTMYEFKQTSNNADDRAEARMAARLAAEGYDVHFRANDKGGDLVVGGVPTDVKNSRGNITTQMISAAQQGADQVIIDGSTTRLTNAQVRAGIDQYEAMAGQLAVGEPRPRHPKLRDLKTAFIVLGDGTIYVYHRDTSLKKAH
ncbi:MAG: DUF4157 domain-containing protein [Methylococcaceae bacterium]|nr:DUF4157 domain-containing protein [Methylococcaceae bacterium]MDP2392049.1 DUF4157 domain-containing protein [Methylococcaceae bacterium]MDP3020953.1 DUF4157 domain-containing protein [Methylococcaceae bacterium]MDP3391166.1 DUF4157 domain-containing protein [Methylococcaceae bacterium]MDP3931709.1 DUF4157 domain-containing protein [Methylococcaceae bacterium]